MQRVARSMQHPSAISLRCRKNPVGGVHVLHMYQLTLLRADVMHIYEMILDL